MTNRLNFMVIIILIQKKSGEFCSEKMHRMIVQSFLRLQKAEATVADKLSANQSENTIAAQIISQLSDSERYDAMLSEAIRSTCQYIDRRLQASTHSGSTMSSLFLKINENDESIRVLCGNVGDSRTVMVTCEQTEVNSFDPSGVNDLPQVIVDVKDSMNFSQDTPEEKVDVIYEEGTSEKFGWKPDSKGNSIRDNYIGESDHSDATFTTEASSRSSATTITKANLDVLNVSHTSSRSGTDLGASSHSVRGHHLLAKVYPMSDDHTLQLPRERTRILAKEEIPFHSLPTSPLGSQSKLDAADEFVKLLVDQISLDSPQDGKYFEKRSSGEATSQEPPPYNPSNDYESRNSQPFQLVRQESFIARRRGANGEIGPEAVFGRYNVSVMMTRSLGDRFGPRCCRGVPDIKAVTIPSTQHARFIIASDGMWDVITSEYVRCNALRSKYINPKVFANALAQKARKMREIRGLRMDDITVLVIDVNGGDLSNDSSQFKVINTKHGADTLVDGKSVATQVDSATCHPSCCIS